MSRRSSVADPRAAAEPPFRRPIAVRSLSRNQPFAFDLSPEPDEAGTIARFLGLEALTRLRFRGALTPTGDEDWRIEGRLRADLVQSCVVTLDPVAQHVDEPVTRDYVPEADYSLPAEIDVDPDAQDDPDPFGTAIDPGLLALESLALLLDPYPRAPGAPAAEYRVAPPGVTPLSDDDVKPFAKLAVLKDKLGGPKADP